MKKGTLITVTSLTSAWRTLTTAERNAWYEAFHADCRAGRDVWHDSAGESRLAPMTDYKDLEEGTRLLVMRARVAAPRGYHTVAGCMEVLNLDSGESLFVRKSSLGL